MIPIPPVHAIDTVHPMYRAVILFQRADKKGPHMSPIRVRYGVFLSIQILAAILKTKFKNILLWTL